MAALWVRPVRAPLPALVRQLLRLLLPRARPHEPPPVLRRLPQAAVVALTHGRGPRWRCTVYGAPTGPQAMARRRPGRTAALAVVAAAGVGLVVEPRIQDLGIVAALGAVRVTRVAIAGTQMAVDYKWLGRRENAEDKAAYDRAQRIVHQRGADRLLRLFSANGGIYVKSGQYLASLGNAIPREYIATLSVLQDRAPHQPFSAVRRLFRQETGHEPEAYFQSIEEEPIASASLAQVHRAYTFDGQKVAVKVQYPDVSRLYETDLWAMAMVARITSMLFENVDLKWMVEEFKVNAVRMAQLRREVNFINEGQNAERVTKLFANRDDLKIPTIRWDLTTRRILTMEFIDGIKVNNVPELKAAGHQPADVAQTMLEVFSDMIFVHGFVHCDPHPGNLMVRRGERQQTQLVLLDHGLYRELTEAFRREHCVLWKALIELDDQQLRRSAEALGAGKYYQFFPLMFTFQRWGGTSKLGQRMTSDDVQKLKAEMSTVKLPDLLDFLESAPRDLLLVMRTTNLLRSINRDLGGTSFQRFSIMANTAVRGIYEKDTGEARSWSEYAHYTLSSASVRFRLWWIQAAATAVTWWYGGGGMVAVAQEVASAVAGADGISEDEKKMIEHAMAG